MLVPTPSDRVKLCGTWVIVECLWEESHLLDFAACSRYARLCHLYGGKGCRDDVKQKHFMTTTNTGQSLRAHVHVCVYVYVCACVCMCVCVTLDFPVEHAGVLRRFEVDGVFACAGVG